MAMAFAEPRNCKLAIPFKRYGALALWDVDASATNSTAAPHSGAGGFAPEATPEFKGPCAVFGIPSGQPTEVHSTVRAGPMRGRA